MTTKILRLTRARAALVAALAAAVATAIAAQQPSPAAHYAITNVSIIPMDTERVVPDQTVLVRGTQIVALGRSADVKVPEGAVTVDGTGKFLIPALAEMHAHIPPGDDVPDAVIERTLFMYAANGIGVVRGMLGHPRHLEYRERAKRLEIFSPTIRTSGPSLNGKSVPTPEAAVKLVNEQRDAGYDFLKIHPGLGLDAFNAMVKTANERHIRFAGHVPEEVGLQRALRARYHTIDHLDGYMEALAGPDAPPAQWFGVNLVDRVDVKRIPELVKATRLATTWIVPTETLLEQTVNDQTAEELSQRPEMKYATPEQVKAWTENKAKFLQIPSEQRKKFIEIRRTLIKAFFDGGVPILLGSDAPQIWNIPGFSAHRELELMVASGLTPYQALQTGTINVARFIGTADQMGQIVANRRADVVLLEANPLTDIRNTAKIAGVMLGGRWMSKEDIQKRLDAGT